MNISHFSEINKFDKLRFVSKLTKSINEEYELIKIKNLSGSSGSLTIASAFKKTSKTFIVFTYSFREAEEWYHNLSLFLDNEKLALLVPPQKKVKVTDSSIDSNLSWLIDGLNKISKNDSTIVITTPDIFQYSFPNESTIENSSILLKVNENIDFSELCKQFLLNGFDKKDYVESPGDIAIRGGIIDIYPLAWDNPLRIEFWGDEIESIREFESLSQRSIKNYEDVNFIDRVFHSDETDFSSGIFDYIHDNCLLILDTPELIISEFDDVSFPNKIQKIEINSYGKPDIEVKSNTQPQFNSSVRNFCERLIELYSHGVNVILCAEGQIHTERFSELVENYVINEEDNALDFTKYPFSKKEFLDSITWLNQTISNGFIIEEESVAVLTEHELFNRVRFQSHKRSKSTPAISLQEIKQLNIGDYVVHVDKGIGKFGGFEKVTFGGSLQDCIKLIFEGGDYLYVNLNYINKIQKYSSQEGVQPKLSKLGSKEWERKKARTKKRLKDIARDLIKLYAKRKMTPGFAFPVDTLWQKEFEASFIYEDTPDQAQTTSEMKKDMEEKSPMDRLICGDVGFGKTEVAIRAAFKAVQAGKQVAILVPTTILAQQHYMTFKDRLSKYPVIVEVMSRFRSKKQQTETLEKLKEGKVDIVIGTHRILSKDIEFKDLGLLVIDEEHRFGVGAKEKLKQFRVNVDTITLTATPIPRTLNFSLMGARDLSVIETPPRNRLPVYTEIIEWKENKIRNAILDEIERNGQVFFVNDTVKEIDNLYNKLQELLPSLKFAIAHGQMKNSELERIMEKFFAGKYDVLLTTKIVESGLDIPNANTIIINSAQNFGLAELYQLRGRVGRSNTQAYCYLIVPPLKTLSTNSLKRLYAIEEFTDLGSGFQLAMRDMEIRGAGNLLGPDQSGYINDIGFELFHRILDEVAQELRREEFKDVFDEDELTPKIFENNDVEIQIDTDALIPEDYISKDTDRFSFYKKLYKVKRIKELEEIKSEIKDRFGQFPERVNELFFVIKLRIAALGTGFNKVILRTEKITLELPPESNSEYYEIAFPEISELLNDIPNSKLYEFKKNLMLEIGIQDREHAIEILWRIKRTIKSLF